MTPRGAAAPPRQARGLKTRHLNFIALGSAIGTGLFYGSAEAIQAAGPAVLLVRLVGLGVLVVAVVVLVVVATLVLGEAQVDHRLAQRVGHGVPPSQWIVRTDINEHRGENP